MRYECRHTDYPDLTYEVVKTQDDLAEPKPAPLDCGSNERFIWTWIDPTVGGLLGRAHYWTVCAKIL